VLVALAVVALAGGSLHVVILVLGLLLWDVRRGDAGGELQVRALDYIAPPRRRLLDPAHRAQRDPANIMKRRHRRGDARDGAGRSCSRRRSPSSASASSRRCLLGLMVAEGKEFMFFSPWLIAIPGVALFTLVLAINLVGERAARPQRAGEPRLTPTGQLAKTVLEVAGSTSRSRSPPARSTRCAMSASMSPAARRCASSGSPAAASR